MSAKPRFSAIVVSIFVIILFSHYSYAADKGEKLYAETFTLYKSLAGNEEKVNNKEIWETIARAFYSIYINYPDSEKAPNSLFISGKMYEEMGERFGSEEDLERAVDYSRLFVTRYPESSLADDAQLRVARIVEKESKSAAYVEYEKITVEFPNGDMKTIAKNKTAELSPFKPAAGKTAASTGETETDKSGETSGLASVSQIRHWSTDNFTRVVIHVDEETPFKSMFLKEDKANGKPPRLLVDIYGTKVDKNLYVEPITKGLLEEIRFARNTSDRVRVVLYIKSFEDYKVFALKDPFRIVMDIQGNPKGHDEYYAVKKNTEDYKYEAGLPEDQVSSLSQALGLKIRTVVIDAGHGGHDPGAIGPSGLKEKQVTLDIAKALKEKLDRDGRKYGITNVYLTRSDDRFIPLEERTGIAKKQGADLFISIHCNAARDKQAYGTETYFLSLTKDQRSLAVAARENATTSISRGEMSKVLKQYLLSAKIEESQRLAGHVQNSVVSNMSGKYQPVKNKGVKRAPFVVLIGADIPSILVETAFITNPRDEQRLKSDDYIDEMADGIFSGIVKFSSEVQTASLE
ncbi:MAG: N-acetylmuramoyl-L-alanine amidase [Thermodesulfobacteriota bacterium]